MCKRSGILDELGSPEGAHILDPTQGSRGPVGDEFLLTIDGQAFLETQLEPVTTSDPVSRPVVEVLVCDDSQYMSIVVIGGMQWISQ
jgi:hypothetical protein